MNLSFKYELWQLTNTHKFLHSKTASFLNKILCTKKIKALSIEEENFYNNLNSQLFSFAEQNIKNMIDLGLNERLPRFAGMKVTLSLERIRNGSKNNENN